jgi:hypothetical protein
MIAFYGILYDTLENALELNLSVLAISAGILVPINNLVASVAVLQIDAKPEGVCTGWRRAEYFAGLPHHGDSWRSPLGVVNT